MGSAVQPNGDVSTLPAEARIMAAASAEFARKGLYGARTQSIAEQAGVNKAMVHYYFRSKEKLYREVLTAPMMEFATQLQALTVSYESPDAFLDGLVDIFMDLFMEHRNFLRILLREVAEGAARLEEVSLDIRIQERVNTADLIAHMQTILGAAADLTPDEIFHLFVSVNGMTMMSFISPSNSGKIWDYDFSDFDEYLDRRRALIKEILQAFLAHRRLRQA